MTPSEPCLCKGKAKPCGRCRLAELARARLAEKAAKAGATSPAWPATLPRRSG